MDTKPTPDGPNASIDLGHRSTQVNLWMIVAVVLFFVLGGFYLAHVFHHPPVSTTEMKQSLNMDVDHWTAALC